MTIAERHKHILESLNLNGFVSVADLSEKLAVSTVTIRKDLQMLEDKGLLYRSHGSATKISPYVNDRPVNEKALVNVEEKQRIAEKATEMLEPQDAIIIGSGTTVTAFAKAIPKNASLTVLTSALNVTLELINSFDIEIVQLGGIIRKSSSSVVGHYAEEMMNNFACSKLFLSVDGISIDHGFTTSNMQEAHLNKKMMHCVQKTIVLADSSKFGKKGFGKICDLEDVDHIITNESIPQRYQKALEGKGIELSIV